MAANSKSLFDRLLPPLPVLAWNPLEPNMCRSFLRISGCIATVMLLTVIPSIRAAGPDSGTDILNRHALATRHFGNDSPWYEENIPFFDCSDPEITEVYYYRWGLWKAHLKDLG